MVLFFWRPSLVGLRCGVIRAGEVLETSLFLSVGVYRPHRKDHVRPPRDPTESSPNLSALMLTIESR